MKKQPKPKSATAPQDFLLEIGCEELPADYMPAALNWNEQAGLAAAAAAVLSEKDVASSAIQVFGTPRRLVLQVSGLRPVIMKTEEGPPVQVAFDAQGKPTRAAEAFANRHGVPIGRLKKKDTPKGPRVYVEYSRSIVDVLAEAIPEIISKLSFPKTMRWEATNVRFARPIRWLLALYGPQVVPCQYASLKSGRVTYNLRRDGSRPVSISSVETYFPTLRRLKIELEQGGSSGTTPKRDRLRKALQAAAKRLGGRLPDETSEDFQWLLNTVTFLAENPVVAVGSFRPEYLDLPVEVLATSMAKHLKLFSVYAPGGKKLLPKFLAVLEGNPKNVDGVMANVERIIEARFTDARFFYREDTKTSLETKVPELAKVVFHEKLGSVLERVHHLPRLVTRMVTDAKFRVDSSRIEKAAQLCKADLVTQLVREFPSLQGVMGGYYARHDGQPDEVARAIAEHYRPRAAKDPVPTTPLGACLSLADRLDTLIGYFGVGLKPTSSVDPYGLRRQALGAVRIILEPPAGLSFTGLSIDRVLEEGIQSWGSRLTVEPKTLKQELRAFLRERFEWVAFVTAKFEREQIDAVLSADDDDLAGAWDRLTVLQKFWADAKQKNTLIKAAKVAERTGRMVKSAKTENGSSSVDPQMFKDEAERKLWNAWTQIAPRVASQVQARQYSEAVSTYSTLYPEVHQFFETVFVMDEDAAVRRNRLALIHEIHQSLAKSFADLSKLMFKEE